MNRIVTKATSLIVLGCCLIILNVLNLKAQDKKVGLTIGDQVPDLQFAQVMNANYKSARLSDFKGKYVIIDFWATWCAPCVGAFPKLGKLAEKFKDKLVILAVTRETDKVIGSFFKPRPGVLPSNIPVVYSDTSVNKLFPHRMIPHEVIINPDGKVITTTSTDDLTEENLEKLFKQHEVNFKVKKDNVSFNPYKPLLLGGLNENANSDVIITYSSIFTPFNPSIRAGAGQPFVKDGYAMIQATNADIETLYQTAFASKPKPYTLVNDPNWPLRYPSRLVWEAKDSTRYYYPGRPRSNRRVQEDSQFCYEVVMLAKDVDKLNSWMVADLNRYFGELYGIEGLVEKRKVKCLSLVRIPGISVIPSKGGKKATTIDGARKIFDFSNSTTDEFLFMWMSFHLFRYMTPILNETEYKTPLDFRLDADPKDIWAVSKALEAYGFKLVETEKELDMIVIRDKK
ncbi:TlpA family protein disulfide reductase [Pedobacter nanyangensis]|uniref:TlpA family protein disulfide reductase n=1 Tax=Pedobacter nanyangensis TaxID=1562389 RepID=UPI000DE5481B|nr:TlpA disulfide reductase family protein [Pedobacter nanyangensis]